MPPIKTVGKVIKKIKLAGDVWLIEIEFVSDSIFVAGQYVSLKVDESGTRRSYSVANYTKNKSFELVIDVSPMGIGSKFILDLEEGKEVEILGFLGRFVLEKEKDISMEKILFVATGTGVAPFRTMVGDLLESGYNGGVDLLWGMRYVTDIYWQDIFEEMQEKHERFNYSIVISKPDNTWKGKVGHVGDFLNSVDRDWSKTRVYICGLPAMIDEVSEKLKTLGVLNENIIFERFS